MLKRFSDGFRRFMYGRYGSDKLNTALLILGIAMVLLSSFPGMHLLGVISYVPLLLAIFRMYSRNLTARRQENQKFLNLINQLKDRDHRYYRCPQCKKKIRVPKGVGTISIRCPRCNTRFTKKTYHPTSFVILNVGKDLCRQSLLL